MFQGKYCIASITYAIPYDQPTLCLHDSSKRSRSVYSLSKDSVISFIHFFFVKSGGDEKLNQLLLTGAKEKVTKPKRHKTSSRKITLVMTRSQIHKT